MVRSIPSWLPFCLLFALAAQFTVCHAAPLEHVARETGLDLDLVTVITVDTGTTDMTITFVFVNERTFQSRISPRLSALLRPFIGRNAVYVNVSVETTLSRLPFDPTQLRVEQDGISRAATPDLWVEITPGFLAGFTEVNPMGAARGSGSEGLLILDDAVDATRPMRFDYAGQRATLAVLPAPRTPTAPGQRPEAGDVAPWPATDLMHDLMLGETLSSGAIAAAIGLDPDLVRTIQLRPTQQTDLRMALIRLTPAIDESDLPEELLHAVRDVIESGAVMVWAASRGGAPFSVWNFYLVQDLPHAFLSRRSFLPEAFAEIARIEPGAVLAGVLLLERFQRAGFDPQAPFSVFYAGQRIEFP